MYPRNAASPEPIAIGPVVQISDGAVQTAGVTVRVKPIGVAESDGGGTTAYSTDGVVLYTPTQAETNYTSFVLIAKKTACIPASVTVVTSARSVSGEVQVGGYAAGQVPLQPTTAGRTLDVSAGGEAGIDLANIGSPTTTVNLSGLTIKTATDIETDTQDIQARLPAALVDGRIVANAQVVGDKTGYTATVSDKTGFKLASDGLALVTSWTVGITGNITGNLIGNVTGEVAELGSNALSANSLTDEISLAVWNALTTTTYTDGSFGDRLLISTNNTRSVAVTGSGHVAAVLHDAEPNSIPEDAFVTGAVSARALAADAATEIATAVGTLQVLVDMGVMIINDGTGNARYSVSALQNAPSGGGGSIINVYPVSASTPERVAGTTITFYRNESRTVSVVTDFTLTALTLVFVIEDLEGNDLLIIADGSITRSDKTFTVAVGTDVTAKISNYRWALRDITNGTNSVISRGVFSVQEAASSA